MKSDKIHTFMTLAGQPVAKEFVTGTPEQRKLGAQLLLSEVLEYVIKGLGVLPEYQGTKITDPEGLRYHVGEQEPNKIDMIDGLADTAYTMYWNAEAFRVPLEEAFELVCDNNLDKFVLLTGWTGGERELHLAEWDCGQSVVWPKEVSRVEVKLVDGKYFAVGKDERGKVRKPSTYQSVDLSALAAQ